MRGITRIAGLLVGILLLVAIFIAPTRSQANTGPPTSSTLHMMVNYPSMQHSTCATVAETGILSDRSEGAATSTMSPAISTITTDDPGTRLSSSTAIDNNAPLLGLTEKHEGDHWRSTGFTLSTPAIGRLTSKMRFDSIRGDSRTTWATLGIPRA